MSKSYCKYGLDEKYVTRKTKIYESKNENSFEKNYILDFDSSSSYFKEEVTLEAGGSGGGGFNWMQFVAGPAQGDIYKDIQENMYTNKRELFGKDISN